MPLGVSLLAEALVFLQALVWITVLLSSAANSSQTPEDTSYIARETVRLANLLQPVSVQNCLTSLRHCCSIFTTVPAAVNGTGSLRALLRGKVALSLSEPKACILQTNKRTRPQ